MKRFRRCEAGFGGSNTFGPYQFPEKLIPLFVIGLTCLTLLAGQQNPRAMVFDIQPVAALQTVALNRQLLIVDGVGHNGGGNERTNHEITNKILELTEKPKSLIKQVADRPGHGRRYALDCAKLRGLGWQPQHSFEEAMQQTVVWYQNREDWWRPITSGESYQQYYGKNYEKR